ncbi:MAG: hypothetical protein V3T05_03575 [Myxococcota bacterium]
MKFELDLKLLIGEEAVDTDTFLAKLENNREEIADIGDLEGAIVVRIDGRESCGEYFDPILRLTDQWLRKIPWILGGDTETVAFRNSEHCFGFVPAGEAVEFSFFVGSETEIEEYVVEPTTIRLQTFTSETLRVAERLLEVIRAIDPEYLEAHEDCRELCSSLEDGRKAWHDYEIHSRR